VRGIERRREREREREREMWGRREKERDKVVWLGRNNSEAMNGAKGAAASSSYDTPPLFFLKRWENGSTK
jgi:hypothetical protein